MSTPAIRALEEAALPFAAHAYDSESLDPDLTYGEAVAAQLNIPPQRLFKTLITAVEDSLVVAVVPVSSSLDLKALAKAVGAKKAEMADPTAAERSTGYVTGGISPFGQRRRLATVVDESALDFERVCVSGGKRGLQIEVSPAAFITLLAAQIAPIAN